MTIVGLTVACLGLASNVILSGPRSADASDPGRVSVSWIDLTTGAGDATFSASDMAPGDTVDAAITVANPSAQPMTYRLNRGLVSAGGAGLSTALVLTIRKIGSSCADEDGTILYQGPLGGAAFGTAGGGLSLAPATAEILCLQATLPRDAGNDVQGTDASVMLSFGATVQAATR